MLNENPEYREILSFQISLMLNQSKPLACTLQATPPLNNSPHSLINTPHTYSFYVLYPPQAMMFLQNNRISIHADFKKSQPLLRCRHSIYLKRWVFNIPAIKTW